MREYKSFCKTVAGNEGDRCHYSTRLDTYGLGCSHNCAYCYARSLLSFRGLWGEPAVADRRKIANAISRKLNAGDVVRLGDMTDCFQSVEKYLRVTSDTIRMLNAKGVHYLIVTKSPLVADNSYLGIMDKRLAHIQVSITSTDDAISRAIEPGAPLPEERIAAVEKLAAAGFDVSVRLSPFFPAWLDLNRIRAIRCDKMLVEFLRVNAFIAKLLKDYDLSAYTKRVRNYRHLSLTAKCDLLRTLDWKGQLSVCEDVAEHQDYWTKYVNHNPADCCNLCL